MMHSRRWFYQDALEPVAEVEYDVNEAFTKLKTFVYATQRHTPDFMVVRTFANAGNATSFTTQVYRLISDHLGSVRLVVDANCNAAKAQVYSTCVKQRIDYDEFGRVLDRSLGKGLQPFGFAGGLYDPDTKLVRFGARDYDSYTGRWTARDPLLFGGGQGNLHVYVAWDFRGCGCLARWGCRLRQWLRKSEVTWKTTRRSERLPIVLCGPYQCSCLDEDL